MLSIKLSDFSEVRKSSGEFLWCRFSMLFVLIQIYQSETFYSSSIEISYRCSGFQVEVTARGTLWWSVYFHSIFFFFLTTTQATLIEEKSENQVRKKVIILPLKKSLFSDPR